MFYQTALGSSPRVWGQDLFPPICNRLRRIIPTRVGTSKTGSAYLHQGKDHPHACGDKFSVIYIRFFIPGSSPHVWGQVPFFAIVKHIFRIIPTRMGTSSTVPPLICFGKDHPHAYGDKVIIIDEGQLLTGSSPRVWGQV